MGQPPAPPAGLTGVEFAVRTLGPQIQLASYDLDRRFGIDDAVAGRRSVDLARPPPAPRGRRPDGPLQAVPGPEPAVRRAAPDAPDDWYAAKARIAKAELDEVLDRLALRWNEADVAARAIATTRFSTRHLEVTWRSPTTSTPTTAGAATSTTRRRSRPRPASTFAVGPLAAPSDNTFAVRAFDAASGIEEANTDARVRVVIDAVRQRRDRPAQRRRSASRPGRRPAGPAGSPGATTRRGRGGRPPGSTSRLTPGPTSSRAPPRRSPTCRGWPATAARSRAWPAARPTRSRSGPSGRRTSWRASRRRSRSTTRPPPERRRLPGGRPVALRAGAADRRSRAPRPDGRVDGRDPNGDPRPCPVS